MLVAPSGVSLFPVLPIGRTFQMKHMRRVGKQTVFYGRSINSNIRYTSNYGTG